MPIEDETKFYLSVPPEGLSVLVVPQTLEQHYVGAEGARIRRTSNPNADKYIFTWKHTLVDGRLMEIECLISEEDFTLLRAEATSGLTKLRHELPREGAGHWEVDCISCPDGGEPLWFAEVESWPEAPWSPGMPAHHMLTVCVDPATMVMLPRGDHDFTNASMSRSGGVARARARIASIMAEPI